jgi:hypothetical protein
MAKIVIESSSLTQPLILYTGLKPAMLDSISGVMLYLVCLEEIFSC